jgi:hypothetical protein
MGKTPISMDEEIVYEGVYKPFSIVRITPKYLIGKGMAKIWPGQFHGRILLSDILRVERKYYWFSKSSVKLFITYKKEDGTEIRKGILFYESYIKHSDFDPEKFCGILLEAMQKE